MAPENIFAGAYLDRRSDARHREDWLDEARGDEHALYIGMRAGAALVSLTGTAGQPRIAFLHGADPRVQAARDPEGMVLLGWYHSRRCLLVELPEQVAAEREGEALAELRPMAGDLPPDEAGLLAYARALNLWRANHRYCSRCGSPSRSARAGHVRQCAHCGHESFPRLDPAIIVLVHSEDAALLGRQANWPPGRYSTIAGFVEPGESLEDAVRREVHEETGITTDDINYHSSQPWPFPASLMLGFTARASKAAPVLHDGELEDARWFTREQLQSGAVGLPPAVSISRRLIDGWLHAA
jgi:NAD+ diphosphatase